MFFFCSFWAIGFSWFPISHKKRTWDNRKLVTEGVEALNNRVKQKPTHSVSVLTKLPCCFLIFDFSVTGSVVNAIFYFIILSFCFYNFLFLIFANVINISQSCFYSFGKKWLFWFFEALARVSGKTKCAICVLAKIVLKCVLVKK